MYAHFLYAQEIGERRRGGYAPRPPCRPHFKCADGGDSVSKGPSVIGDEGQAAISLMPNADGTQFPSVRVCYLKIRM